MKRTWMALFATLAALVCAQGIVHAQGPMVRGATPPGSFLQAAPNGQTYLMVPNKEPVQPASFGGGTNCEAPAGCTSGDCGKTDCCDDCFEGWCHRFYAYGGFMYLRARDSEVAYAVNINGALTQGGSAVQVSPVAVLDQDYQPGFFVGFGMVLDECSSIGVNYMQFESSTNSSITANPTLQLPAVTRSLVVHPGTLNAAADGLYADGKYDINFNIADIEYRGLIDGDCDFKFNYLVGIRLAQSEQQLTSNFDTILGRQTVSTDLDFYGAGIKLGLEYERMWKRGFMVYGKTYASFVPGEFQADYDQTSAFDPSVVDTGWRAGRLVTMLDLEVGGGWVSCCGNYRLTAGYVISAWLNTVQTDEWIHAVQTNNYIDMSSMTSFDGLTARFEARF